MKSERGDVKVISVVKIIIAIILFITVVFMIYDLHNDTDNNSINKEESNVETTENITQK